MCPKLLKTVWFGSFVIDDKRIVDKVLFKQKPEHIAAKLVAISKDQVLEEERTLIERHTPEATTDERLAHLGLEVLSSDWTPSPGEFGFRQDLLAKATRLTASIKSRDATTPDLYIIQALETYDTLLEVRNLFVERLRNYYALHWPDLVEALPENRYLSLIAEHGDHKAITSSNEPDLPDDQFVSDIPASHSHVVQQLAIMINDFSKKRDALESHISSQMEDVAPNLSALTGPLIGARLISLAGSLERLSKLPSSTVQVLGAEKAMFRSKKERTKPPKHGVIFVHPLIRTAPHWRRGNIARAIAGKAAIAAKVDFYNGEFIGDTLKTEFEKKVEAINKRYPKPPKRGKH